MNDAEKKLAKEDSRESQSSNPMCHLNLSHDKPQASAGHASTHRTHTRTVCVSACS